MKFSSRSNIRNPSKLHLSSKFLPGVFEEMEVPDEPEGGVNRDPTSETLPRLHLSSKYLPGVFEYMDDPDRPGDRIR